MMIGIGIPSSQSKMPLPIDSFPRNVALSESGQTATC